MPVANVHTAGAAAALAAPPAAATPDDYSTFVSTAQGLALVEIQGELSLPRERPQGLNAHEETLFQHVTVPEILRAVHTVPAAEETVEVVKFGRLEIDESMKRATLFISTTQRLIGSVEKIDPPLGLLKIYTPEGEGEGGDSIADCEIADVLTTKIIFKQRPLPIM